MEEIVRLVQDGTSYRVYINMEHKSSDKYIAIDFLRKLPRNIRRYHSELKYWSVTEGGASILVGQLIRKGIIYTLEGTLKIDPVQTTVDDGCFQQMGICKRCKRYQGLFIKTGLCSRCS